MIYKILLGTTISMLAIAESAIANCADYVISLDDAQPKVQKRWEDLQKMEVYPWGRTQIYQELKGDRITLASSFDQLRNGQKQAALNLLQLGSYPHQVYASDGRLLSAVYDGCTRFNLLTERDRFSWYYNAIGRYFPQKFPKKDLRNAGRPDWRRVKVEISEAEELAIRLLFWQKMGYAQSQSGLWIAWVPEHGYFEVNVPVGYDLKKLGKFWGVAPRKFRYMVLAADGTIVMDANFDT